METKKKKAVIYARVSSREQEETGYSLPSQVKLLKEYAERKDLNIVKIFSIAESASGSKKRVVFSEMMKYLREKKVDNLLCEKVDRLTRNFREAIVADDWIEGNKDKYLHFVKQNLVIHADAKSDEKFRWDIEIVLAKKYISNLSEEVKKGQKEKVSQGWLPTKPPIGYRTIGEKGHKIHIINEDVAPLVVKMFKLYATGNYSTKALAEKMAELSLRNNNGNKVVKSRIHELLKDPFYYGKFVWNGELYEGQHKPLITKSVFDAVQEKMGVGKTSPYYTKHCRVLQGKIDCGNCNKIVTWENQKGTIYGGCKQCKSQLDAKRKYIKQSELEDVLVSKIVSIAPTSEKVLKVLEKALKESHSEEIACYDAKKTSLNNQMTRIKQRMDTMYEDRLDHRISIEVYDEKYSTFKNQSEDLQRAISDLESNNTAYYQAGFAVHELAMNTEKVYRSKNATREQKRLLLSYAISNVSVLMGVTNVEYTPTFSFLAEWMPKVNKCLELSLVPEDSTVIKGDVHSLVAKPKEEDEFVKNNSRTQENPYVERQKSTCVPFHPDLLRRQDSNLTDSVDLLDRLVRYAPNLTQKLFES